MKFSIAIEAIYFYTPRANSKWSFLLKQKGNRLKSSKLMNNGSFVYSNKIKTFNLCNLEWDTCKIEQWKT